MITRAEAKEHLRVKHEYEDDLIDSYIEAAEDYCRAFLGFDPDEDFEELPGMIRAGLLVHIAVLFESRKGEFIEKNLRSVDLLYWPY